MILSDAGVDYDGIEQEKKNAERGQGGVSASAAAVILCCIASLSPSLMHAFMPGSEWTGCDLCGRMIRKYWTDIQAYPLTHTIMDRYPGTHTYTLSYGQISRHTHLYIHMDTSMCVSATRATLANTCEYACLPAPAQVEKLFEGSTWDCCFFSAICCRATYWTIYTNRQDLPLPFLHNLASVK